MKKYMKGILLAGLVAISVNNLYSKIIRGIGYAEHVTRGCIEEEYIRDNQRDKTTVTVYSNLNTYKEKKKVLELIDIGNDGLVDIAFQIRPDDVRNKDNSVTYKELTISLKRKKMTDEQKKQFDHLLYRYGADE